MISRLSGILRQIHEQYALVENSGVTYEVLLPSAVARRLKDEGANKDISFETLYYIEAGDKKSNHFPRLVGFTNPIDREFFQVFTQVPGMGIKKALKSLILPIRDIAIAIENRDTATLRRLPGVGNRLAEVMIAELNGKVAKFALSRDAEPLAVRETVSSPVSVEALEVLLQLQYKRPEAEEMIAAAMKANPQITLAEELIRMIFRNGQKSGVEVL
jgi:Holliday junction DNA helicase RuvA